LKVVTKTRGQLEKSQTGSLQLAVNGSFMKLFKTRCKDTVHACMHGCIRMLFSALWHYFL